MFSCYAERYAAGDSTDFERTKGNSFVQEATSVVLIHDKMVKRKAAKWAK